TDLEVAADLALGGRRPAVVVAVAAQGVGGEREAAAGHQVPQAAELAVLRDLEAGEIPPLLQHRTPGRLLLAARQIAPDVEAPHLGVLRRVAQGLERDGEFRPPARGVARRGHRPDAVPLQALPLAFVAYLAVDLHSERVGGEEEA